jgi:phospholipase C
MRSFLVASAIALVGSATVFACSSNGAAPSPPAGDGGVTGDANTGDSSAPGEAGVKDAGAPDVNYGFTTPPAWDQPVTRPSDDAGAAGRASCMYARGAMPAATLGPSTPIDTQIPIDTIVVLMMENRSFDSLLGHLNEYGNRKDINEPPAGASNPSVAADWDDAGPPNADAGDDAGGFDAGGDGATIPWMHATAKCFADTDHSWKGQHWAYDYGLNDGFFAENNLNSAGDAVPDGGVSLLSGQRAMWYYDQTDIPFEYQLANSFAIADNYFCSLLGPTNPNRDYLIAATSFGVVEDGIPNLSTNVTDNVVVPDELEQRNVTWASYGDSTTGIASVLGATIGIRYPQKIRFSFADFLKAAAAGTLPHVAWLDPNLGMETATGNDDHPPGDPQVGSNFLSQVYQAVTSSPQWSNMALFITWDENGGEYDHVPPGPACVPDTIAPILAGTDVGVQGGFDRYGFRVPLIVVSPYAKKGYVSHNVYDHTSIARFIETKFKIPALTGRDANADPLMDLFDFTDPPAFTTAPTIAPTVVDDAGLQECITLYGK